MISLLHIKNLGIIEDITLNLEEGFNVLTGETGSGKSLIIDSFGIISGGRFSKEMIRKGENSSLVEVCIWLETQEIIVSREIFINGRNICKINGRLVTVSELKDFMGKIIDIAKQHENQNIMDVSYHIKYLDNFIGDKISDKLNQYKELFLKYNSLKMELKLGFGDEKEKQRKLDLLEYQINEIDDAGLKDGEEEVLETQRKQISNIDKINENLEISGSSLNDVVEGLETSIRSLEKIENFDEKYQKKLEELKNSYYDIEEISRDIYNFKYELDFDSSSKEEIEDRLDLINNLKRKYGNSIKEILDYRNEVEKEIFDIKNLEERNIEIRRELKEIKNEMTELSTYIHNYRIEYSKILAENINQELSDLSMKNSKLLVDVIENEEGKFNENGIDKVEFLICTNTGEDFLPLTKIASGGELSRIMLAIKTVLNDIDNDQKVLIFDEIDTGISGIAARAVSSKMKKIAKNHQIFVVSHLAVIAASAENNYFSYKIVEDGKTKTNVKKIDGEELINEIARISSGDMSKVSKEHAKELLKLSKVA